MAVLAETEQDEIERPRAAQVLGVGTRGGARSALGRDYMHLVRRDGDVVEPSVAGHAAVALDRSARHAALVAVPDVPARPVGVGRAQQPIRAARRRAAREHDIESVVRRDRRLRGSQDAGFGIVVECGRVGQRMPARPV